jgi:ADP-ribosylglycohydrolase
LIQSVMAGGDSAGRNLLAGMVLGAHLGMEALPDDWIAGMRKGPVIREHLSRIP